MDTIYSFPLLIDNNIVPLPINSIIPDDAIEWRKLGFQFFKQFKALLEHHFFYNNLLNFARTFSELESKINQTNHALL